MNIHRALELLHLTPISDTIKHISRYDRGVSYVRVDLGSIGPSWLVLRVFDYLLPDLWLQVDEPQDPYNVSRSSYLIVDNFESEADLVNRFNEHRKGMDERYLLALFGNHDTE